MSACRPARSPKDRLKAITSESPDSLDSSDERPLLERTLALIEKEAATGAKIKDAQEALLAKGAAQYGRLSEDEIQTLAVGDKWLALLAAAVQGELDRVSQTLTGRIRQLTERYASPLPQLTDEVATLAALQSAAAAEQRISFAADIVAQSN
jgi:type I restriction enzyme M protein